MSIHECSEYIEFYRLPLVVVDHRHPSLARLDASCSLLLFCAARGTRSVQPYGGARTSYNDVMTSSKFNPRGVFSSQYYKLLCLKNVLVFLQDCPDLHQESWDSFLAPDLVIRSVYIFLAATFTIAMWIALRSCDTLSPFCTLVPRNISDVYTVAHACTTTPH